MENLEIAVAYRKIALRCEKYKRLRHELGLDVSDYMSSLQYWKDQAALLQCRPDAITSLVLADFDPYATELLPELDEYPPAAGGMNA